MIAELLVVVVVVVVVVGDYGLLTSTALTLVNGSTYTECQYRTLIGSHALRIDCATGVLL